LTLLFGKLTQTSLSSVWSIFNNRLCLYLL